MQIGEPSVTWKWGKWSVRAADPHPSVYQEWELANGDAICYSEYKLIIGDPQLVGVCLGRVEG